ncbi:MAG: hypothetical protein ACJ8C4_20780 [Gemmataceae bacterium]
MHRKLINKDVTVISLNVDEVSERDNVLAFLKKQQPQFQNLLIDEPADVWQEKLHTNTPPTVLVYGRDGKLIKEFGSEKFTIADVEAVVMNALK